MCVSVETMRCKDSAVVKVLHLTLHRKWFDAIASGQKREEYIDRTDYWQKRIKGHKHTEIHFRNGYRKDAPFMRVNTTVGVRRFLRAVQSMPLYWGRFWKYETTLMLLDPPCNDLENLTAQAMVFFCPPPVWVALLNLPVRKA